MKAMLVLAGLAFGGTARADVISEEQARCNGKSAGDECGTDGTCVTETCSRTRPGGNTSTWDCLVCHPGTRSGGSRSLVVGIVVAVVLIGGGVAFAYRRRKDPA